MSSPTLLVLTREDCELCAHMLDELAVLSQGVELPAVAELDVDSDAQLRQRFGLKVPVLLLDGQPVCHGRLDRAELLRLLRRRLPTDAAHHDPV